MLVSAVAGSEHVVSTYEETVKQQYRFFPSGDAVYIVSKDTLIFSIELTASLLVNRQ